ncbi:Hypothetical_protein [Hexamita inflata]|uniref:Hypothetical_protein n=1 Tax=Hexamita inflata TaxID=28002 RepID=A0AA86RC48_9EUKA|nr:Hypothetical protein HINF_LOCUS58012 [Hexamita inflata]
MVQNVSSSFGCIFGQIMDSLFIIQNSSVGNSSLIANSSTQVGGFIGYIQTAQSLNYNQIINNSIISHSNISAHSYVGGFLGYTRTYTLITIMNSKIQNVRLDATSYQNYGFISGYNEEIQMKFINSSSMQYYINNGLRDCAVIRDYKWGC